MKFEACHFLHDDAMYFVQRENQTRGDNPGSWGEWCGKCCICVSVCALHFSELMNTHMYANSHTQTDRDVCTHACTQKDG